jgi:ribosome maturation factor RimP
MGFGPFFVCASGSSGLMEALDSIVERVVTGMGFEMVDLQAANRARLMRVFIDRAEGVSVDDCANVSRQLSRVLEVEGVDYDRLEVSSPGLDRRLRRPADFARFAGQRVDVRMRAPDAAGQRRFVGELSRADETTATVVVDGRAVALDYAGMERARLVPNI